MARAPATAVRLGAALYQRGWHVLRVEAASLRATPTPARSLFDWRQQLARGRLDTMATAHGDLWRAPGLDAGAPGFGAVAGRYDVVLLDTDLACDGWTPMPGADNRMIIDVPGESEVVQQVFSLLKTVSRCAPACEVSLVGDGRAGRRLLEAARRFLDIAFARRLACLAEEVEPFATLAARMAHEEKGRSARC